MSQNGRIKNGQREVKEEDKENGIIMLTDETEIRADDIFSIDADIIDRLMPDDI